MQQEGPFITSSIVIVVLSRVHIVVYVDKGALAHGARFYLFYLA
jgi:hypothetical protein